MKRIQICRLYNQQIMPSVQRTCAICTTNMCYLYNERAICTANKLCYLYNHHPASPVQCCQTYVHTYALPVLRVPHSKGELHQKKEKRRVQHSKTSILLKCTLKGSHSLLNITMLSVTHYQEMLRYTTCVYIYVCTYTGVCMYVRTYICT